MLDNECLEECPIGLLLVLYLEYLKILFQIKVIELEQITIVSNVKLVNIVNIVITRLLNALTVKLL